MKIIIAMIFMCVVAMILGSLLTASYYERAIKKTKCIKILSISPCDTILLENFIGYDHIFIGKGHIPFSYTLQDDDTTDEGYSFGREKGYRTPNPESPQKEEPLQ